MGVGADPPPLGGGQAQPGRAQAAKELAARDLDRPGLDEIWSEALRDVVVIALESASRDADRVGELLELVDAHVAHEVAPPFAAEPPQRLVDQDRHRIEPVRPTVPN